jgi:hypothetical protein
MIVILKKKGLWDLIKCKVTSTNFLAIVGGESLIEKTLKKKNREHI